MGSDFRLLMLSAMYENGGNTAHRLLDGHPQMFVYPFESQLGTLLVRDHLASLFPAKYRWPIFDLESTPEEDFQAIIDEETRVRIRTPHVSKFRHVPLDLSDDERKAIYVDYTTKEGRSRPQNVESFFKATFDAWKDYKRTGEEVVYVGYSPIIVVDAETILAELPNAHVLHIVRNPWSAYADTCKRPMPLPLEHYTIGWALNQHYALFLRERIPGRFHLIRFEDLIGDPYGELGSVCEQLSLERTQSLRIPTWNSERLTEVYPWGMIRLPTPGANTAAAKELSARQCDEIRERTSPYLASFDYRRFL